MSQRVKNTRIKNYFIDILKLNPLQDVIPDYVRQDIQPVVEIDKPFTNIVRYGSCVNAAAVSLYTTPTDKDFYLTAAQIAFIKDATATSVRSTIVATVDGVQQRILDIPQITLTAQTGGLTISFPYPIRIDRGTQILTSGSTTTGNITTDAVIYGYVDTQGGV